MTATANIQNDQNPANQKNNEKKDGEMKKENNINTITRLGKKFGSKNIGKLVAGAALGLALTAAVAASSSETTTVAGYGDMSEENLEFVTSNITVAGLDATSRTGRWVSASVR